MGHLFGSDCKQRRRLRRRSVGKLFLCTGISNPEKIFKPQASLTPSTAHAGGGSGLTFSVGQIGQSFASNFLNLCMPFTILEASLKCHDDVKAGFHTFLGETSFAFTRNAASSVLPSPWATAYRAEESLICWQLKSKDSESMHCTKS